MEEEYNYLQNFFDFHELFKDMRKRTLEFCESAEKFIDFYSVTDEVEKKDLTTLYRFIKDEKAVEALLTEYTASEDQNFNLQDNDIKISFCEDTSIHNEDGSQLGFYEYVFTIDLTDCYIFTGLKIINNN